MLRSFLSPVPADGEPVDFAGVWKNQHGSEMTLKVNNGAVTGEYRTGVGQPPPVEKFPLVGFAAGDLLAFTVNFGKYGSLTAWAGQHTLESGREVIHTMWHLAKNEEDPDEPAKLWGCVLAGADRFIR